jgi:exodeoxyribonuclease VII small subunit
VGAVPAAPDAADRPAPGPPPHDGDLQRGNGHVDDPEPGYEAARDELLEVVSRLETGGLTLEQSLQLWERGEYLASVCERWLDAAERRLDAAGGPPAG